MGTRRLVFGLRLGRGLFDLLVCNGGVYLFLMGTRCLMFHGLRWGTRLVWYLMVCDVDEAFDI